MGNTSESKPKLLLWLQKHHLHSKFKLYYILIQSILSVLLYLLHWVQGKVVPPHDMKE